MNQTDEPQDRVQQKKFKEYDQLTTQDKIHPPLASPKIESEQPIYNYFGVKLKGIVNE
jgi:hypothetical protein